MRSGKGDEGVSLSLRQGPSIDIVFAMKVCLFSYPRTGTSVVFRLMSRYLNAKHGSGLGVGEIFDCGDHLLVDTGTGLKLEDGNATEHYRQEISRRIELLKKYDRQNYSIKVLANQANHGVIEFLAEHYQIVCLERRDQFEAVLSWILARQTGFGVLSVEVSAPK